MPRKEEYGLFAARSLEELIKELRRDARHNITFARNTIHMCQPAFVIEADGKRSPSRVTAHMAVQGIVETCEATIVLWERVLRIVDEMDARSNLKVMTGEETA